MLLGIHLTLMIGPTKAVPAPLMLTEALSSVEVTHRDRGRSGFRLTFQAGRSGMLDLVDYALLANPLLFKAFNRVVLLTTFNVVSRVLMDGVITNVQLQPSNEPGGATLTVIGEDVSLMMDMKMEQVAWPSLGEDNVVRKILSKYGKYGILPTGVKSPPAPNIQPPTREVPVQVGTDLRYINFLAERHGFVFYIKPGPAANVNTAYWGPPDIRDPQKALTVNMGPESNVNSLDFGYNALAPVTISGTIQDAETNAQIQLKTPPLSTRVPGALRPAITFNQPNVRQVLPPVTPEDEEFLSEPGAGGGGGGRRGCSQSGTVQGLPFTRAMARATAAVNASTDEVVTAHGELDAARYGNILEARKSVCVRGAGYSYDGLYRVKSVTHNISRGEYKQRFTLAREGTGALSTVCL